MSDPHAYIDRGVTDELALSQGYALLATAVLDGRPPGLAVPPDAGAAQVYATLSTAAATRALTLAARVEVRTPRCSNGSHVIPHTCSAAEQAFAAVDAADQAQSAAPFSDPVPSAPPLVPLGADAATGTASLIGGPNVAAPHGRRA
jgi:hypothetical protein